jgi:alkylation response protein AidB-like acyl-CoA dehydrogenase
MPIDFTLTPEQKQLQAAARSFARTRLIEVERTIAGIARPEDRFAATKPFYAEMAAAGFVAALLPKRYGGTEMSSLDFAIAAEELSAVDINVPTTLLANGIGLEPLIRFGSDEQKARFLPAFLEKPAEYLAGFAFTEPTGGANFDSPDPNAGVQTFARQDGDHWVLNGRKHYTTNGSGWDGKGAHLLTVVCRTDLSRPPSESLAILVVPGTAPGVQVTGYRDTVGHRAVISPCLTFENVRVPLSNLIGKPGDALWMTPRTFSWTAAIIGAACTGVMRRAFDCAYEFAKADKRAGTSPILDHQNVGYMLADLKMKIEASRYLTWKACHYLDTTHHEGEELAIMTKVFSSELCVQACYDAMRIVGVDSYTDLHPLASLMQDALAFPLYDGGNMGVRRRQLHRLFQTPNYDPMAAAEGRAQAKAAPATKRKKIAAPVKTPVDA